MSAHGTPARFLDVLGTTGLSITKQAAAIGFAAKVWKDVDWIAELKAAVERQEALDPCANSMRHLARHMAPDLLGL